MDAGESVPLPDYDEEPRSVHFSLGRREAFVKDYNHLKMNWTF
jgi:hypothetical protein